MANSPRGGVRTEPDSVSAPESGHLPDGQGAAQANKRRGLLGTVAEVLIIVAAAFAIAMLVQAFIVKPFTIPSESMEPTVMVGDRVLVNRLVYHLHGPRPGDVIVFHEPGQPPSATPLIKRVVAVGGDTVAVHNGFLYLNGKQQAEPFIMGHPILGEFAQVAVPAGYLWVMGDNRNDSADSRVFGPVGVKAIIGEAFAVYWPLNHFKGL